MDLFEFETKASHQGFKNIAGIDEAGRGPLAGPVVAAAVIFPSGVNIPGLNDSKKLSTKKREELFPKIQEISVFYGVAVVDQKVIDKINILQAARLAMKQAVETLKITPGLLLIDGHQKIDSTLKQWAIVKGETGMSYTSGSDEFGSIRYEDPSRTYQVGDKLELIVSHCDPVVNLYDQMYAVRNGIVESVWEISARGQST